MRPRETRRKTEEGITELETGISTKEMNLQTLRNKNSERKKEETLQMGATGQQIKWVRAQSPHGPLD
jgi:hypothetical protein